MRAAFWIVAIWLLSAVDGRAQPVEVTGIKIVEYGIYQATDRQFVDDPNLPRKTRRDVSDVKKLEQTTTILARKNTLFGVRYKIEGEPQGKAVPLVLVTRFPGDVRDPITTGVRSSNKRAPEEFLIGATHFRGYRLEEDWELALTGPWLFEFWHGNQKLKEQVFEVVKPE
jgi:hypothetical protein